MSKTPYNKEFPVKKITPFRLEGSDGVRLINYKIDKWIKCPFLENYKFKNRSSNSSQMIKFPFEYYNHLDFLVFHMPYRYMIPYH